jgi:outer membrane protein assembly factor BamB
MKRKFIWLFFAMLAVVALGNVALATSWSTGQFNFQRTGYNPSSSVDQARLTQAWCYVHPSHLVFRSEPVELNGRVFVTFASFTAAPNQVQALDINTGALLWTNTFTSTGNAARGTPTAATVDTTGSGDFADLVYVANGSSGGGAGVRCIRAADGTTKFTALTGAKRVRYSRPVLADTDGNGSFDILSVGDEGGQIWAFDPVTGALVWGPTVLDLNYWTIFGPSLSTDNKVLYSGTWDFVGATGHGQVHAVDAATGVILGSFDPLTAAHTALRHLIASEVQTNHTRGPV